MSQKWQKEWCYHTFMKEWMKALGPRQDENFGTFGLFLSFVVSEIWPFKVEIPVRAIFSLYF